MEAHIRIRAAPRPRQPAWQAHVDGPFVMQPGDVEHLGRGIEDGDRVRAGREQAGADQRPAGRLTVVEVGIDQVHALVEAQPTTVATQRPDLTVRHAGLPALRGRDHAVLGRTDQFDECERIHTAECCPARTPDGKVATAACGRWPRSTLWTTHAKIPMIMM